MSETVVINKQNRNKFKGVKGTYQVMNNGVPVLKNNGKPWAGSTISMGNYYGVIVGSARYVNVKVAAVWQDGYEIHFTPDDKQL